MYIVKLNEFNALKKEVEEFWTTKQKFGCWKQDIRTFSRNLEGFLNIWICDKFIVLACK